MREYLILAILGLLVVLLAWGAFKLKDRFAILAEFIVFLKERKLWWLIPVFVVFALAGLFVVISAQMGIAPFIYTLF